MIKLIFIVKAEFCEPNSFLQFTKVFNFTFSLTNRAHVIKSGTYFSCITFFDCNILCIIWECIILWIATSSNSRIHSSSQVFEITCVYLPATCKNMRVKLIIFSQITIREESSRAKRPYCNQCVSSNILEKQDKFLPEKAFIISLHSSVLYRFY